MHMRTVQQIIKKLRDLGYTQTLIGLTIKAPQARISRWEKGGAPSSLNDVLKLKDLLENELKKKANIKPPGKKAA